MVVLAWRLSGGSIRFSAKIFKTFIRHTKWLARLSLCAVSVSPFTYPLSGPPSFRSCSYFLGRIKFAWLAHGFPWGAHNIHLTLRKRTEKKERKAEETRKELSERLFMKTLFFLVVSVAAGGRRGREFGDGISGSRDRNKEKLCLFFFSPELYACFHYGVDVIAIHPCECGWRFVLRAESIRSSVFP